MSPRFFRFFSHASSIVNRAAFGYKLALNGMRARARGYWKTGRSILVSFFIPSHVPPVLPPRLPLALQNRRSKWNISSPTRSAHCLSALSAFFSSFLPSFPDEFLFAGRRTTACVPPVHQVVGKRNDFQTQISPRPASRPRGRCTARMTRSAASACAPMTIQDRVSASTVMSRGNTARPTTPRRRPSAMPTPLSLVL